MTTRGKECPYVSDEKWAMCPSCGDSLSRLGIAKDRALPIIKSDTRYQLVGGNHGLL